MSKILKITLLLTFILSAAAQAQTPSQIRQQKQKEKEANQAPGDADKDKKLSPSELRAQNKDKQSKDKIFGDDDNDFTVSALPDKWKNESAVVLCQKMSYSFLRKNSVLAMEESVRKKIKLNDKASLEDYSEFYYNTYGNAYTGSSATIGIQIIKPDGKVIDVDTKNAVDVDEDVPSIYRSYYSTNYKYKKLAIPDLQVGDIIDYFYSGKLEASNALVEYAFSPFIFTLDQKYPVLVQKFEFTIDRGFFINFNSYNGAPSLVEGDAGTDSHGRVRNTIKTFSLEDRNRNKQSKDIWNYEYCTSPTVKFQVIYASPSVAKETDRMMKNSNYFIGEVGKVKSSVTDDEIQSVISRKLDANNPTSYTDEMISYIRKYYPKEKDPGKILGIAYFYMRYQLLNNYYNEYDAYGMLQRAKQYADGYVYVDSYKFTSIMLEVCKRHKIKAEAFVASDREYGNIKDMLLQEELTLGVVAQINGQDVFYFAPNNFSTPALPNPDIQGAEGFAFTPTLIRVKNALKSRSVTIPSSSYVDNTIAYNVNVVLDDQFENIKIKRKTELTGLCKKNMQPMALSCEPYIKNDRKKYDPKYEDESEQTRGNKVRIAEAKRKVEDEKKEREEKQKEKLKDYVKEDFDVVTFDSFTLDADGRNEETPNLIFEEEFTAKNLINKAGKNYIFDIGKLIGKQLELEESEKKRDNDVYLAFAKSFTNEVTVTLPAGYTAEGLNDLNMTVDNESGTFTSTAKVEGGKIIIKTKKSYKKSFDKKDNWPKLMEALETAYKFTQKKVILKKA